MTSAAVRPLIIVDNVAEENLDENKKGTIFFSDFYHKSGIVTYFTLFSKL